PSPAGGAAVPPSSWPGSPGGRAAPGRTGGGAEAVGGGVARLVEVGPAADGAAGQGLAHQHQRGHGGAGGPEVGGQPAHRRPDHGFVGPAGPDDDGRRGVGAVARARRQELGHQLVGPGGGEEHGHGGAVGSEGGHAFSGRRRRGDIVAAPDAGGHGGGGAAGQPGEDDAL